MCLYYLMRWWLYLICTRLARFVRYLQCKIADIRVHKSTCRSTRIHYSDFLSNWFYSYSLMLLLGGEVTQTNFIVFGFTQPKMEYTIYCEHTNLYNNEMGFWKGRITLREHLSSPRFLVGSVFLICLVLCVSFRSECRVVMSVTISASERCSVRLYLLLFVRGRMSYLHFLFVWA